MIRIHCPLCGKEHEYSDDIQSIEVPCSKIYNDKIKTYRRVFTCPVKNQDFQVTIQDKSIEDILRDKGIV